MSDRVKSFSLICNVLLIGVIIFLSQCSNPFVKKATPQYVKMPVKDTMWQKGKEDSMFKHPTISYVPSDPTYIRGKDNIIEVPGETVYIPAKLLTKADSLEILRECLITNIFIDTLRGDNCLIALRDSISRSKILGRAFSIKNNRLTVENNLNPNKMKVFVGAELGLSLNLKTALLAPKISLLTKNDHLYSIGYDFFNSMPLFEMAWKIRIGK